MLEKYAETILKTVALQPGHYLLISSEPIHRPFAVKIAEKAYRIGAAYVDIEHPRRFAPRLNRLRADYCREEYLETIPPSLQELSRRRIDEKWVHISIGGEEHPDAMEGVDPQRSKLLNHGYAPIRREEISARINADIQWQGCYLPTPNTAARMLNCAPSQSAADRAFAYLADILMLDDAAPASRWLEKVGELHRRSDALTAARLAALHFSGPGTDLTVGLPEHHRWLGGAFTTTDGTQFLPNLPTEEVFTSPHRLKTEGRVAVTRPVMVKDVGGQLVDGAWFEFENGRVVEFGAEKGKAALEELLSFDEAAAYLGEVALVDSNSAIFRSGQLWRNTLLDENAACHIALGRGISTALQHGEKLSDQKLQKQGINISTIHTDFMIGSPDIEVRGTSLDGREVNIITDGVFRI